MLINIAKPQKSPHPVLNLGFRLFFLGAALFAVITMGVWHLLLTGGVQFLAALNPIFWHGHEMLFGYGCAVIAGFLLTAVKAWTGVPMPVGWRLLGIFMPWLIARVLWFGAGVMGADTGLVAAWLFDVQFWAVTTFVVTRAVWLARQKRQSGIIAKLMLLLVCQLGFGVGMISHHQAWMSVSLYIALFVIVGVVLTIGRRVLPFFIEKGVMVDRDGKPTGEQLSLPNAVWRDRLSLISFVGVAIGVMLPQPLLLAVSALVCAGVNAWRLIGWHHRGIWQKPLLWSLYLSFWGLVVSLMLLAWLPWTTYSLSLGVHALALTAIGMTTVAMMARVSLGHTGRNIHAPPRLTTLMFGLMILCVLARVCFPMLMDDYLQVLGYSQLLWMMSFVLFVIGFGRMLMQPRVDGLMG
ncbi:hypothetical protein B0681_05740 [Moraxella porci DSM 25326]|uniref:NnrS family protein n=1 Tax=Moraxella porci DSM 25326 TaxID=573983 RepID=A0A1T0CRK3_9GAMM|nr:NnrS family protein [Moraxella porci]OOS24957.1 hypothetical protein B0681_05740 [Moraxella porci DSM 25326]